MVRPLCPLHHGVMSPLPNLHEFVHDGSKEVEIHGHECSVGGCSVKYSPSFGYFSLIRKDDYWCSSQSSSFQIVKSNTQVICGDHKTAMFIESIDAANANLRNYRCPQNHCNETMKIQAGQPPAYWLGSRFFERS